MLVCPSVEVRMTGLLGEEESGIHKIPQIPGVSLRVRAAKRGVLVYYRRPNSYLCYSGGFLSIRIPIV